ncbi:uncharacterized protein [Epargyreus clarus]|uniref:uncharacterized protein n=1 Tax=Epargyreus clarus TaxID=520877 RepID=UPI003C2F536A
MDQSRVQCPVCTLYLHSGMSLESHLDTHPKDQVIKALCCLSAKNVGFNSRTSSPVTVRSERSYRSRSRTPATEDGVRWMSSQRSTDNEKYWRRTPSRNKSSSLSNASRNGTPEIRVGDSNFDSSNLPSSQYSDTSYSSKSDKMQQTYDSNPTGSDYDQQYSYYPDCPEDREVKFSRSSEYTTMDNPSNVFPSYGPQTTQTPNAKLQPSLTSTATRRISNVLKILPKPNLLLKPNVPGCVQRYITPGVKPLHVVVPAAPTFVQKNIQSNMIMTGSTIPCSTMFDTKSLPPQVGTNQMSSSTFTPGTTVVTQNSQIVYREMVHSLNGKPFISSIPAVLGGHNTVTNVAQTSSLYQNVMVVDQFGNSGLYPTGPQVIAKPCNTTFYNDTTFKNMSNLDNNTIPPNNANDAKKTLIIEVSPIITSVANLHDSGTPTSISSSNSDDKTLTRTKIEDEKIEPRFDAPGPSKGLKILSNIKVEVPVQHNKNMLNTVMDLTGSEDNEYSNRSDSPEKILPDIDDTKQNFCIQQSIPNGGRLAPHSFSAIKNIVSSKSECDTKMETEFSDSCPVPDLICNEKPSISPCSELSELGENSTDQPTLSAHQKSVPTFHKNVDNKIEIKIEQKIERDTNIDKQKRLQVKSHKNNALRLNNIYVKKHKKVLQIKNAKSFPVAGSSNSHITEPIPSSSSCIIPENFSINRISLKEKNEIKNDILPIIPIKRIKDMDTDSIHEFDADTEEQSMDIEPIVPSSLSPTQGYHGIPVDDVQVKEEVNTSNEGVFNNETDTSREDTAPESLRPISVISYGNMITGDLDEDSNHKELLELEAASKNKQFANMINENYFGNSLYVDYYTPDRGEAFDAVKESNAVKNSTKDGIYNIWNATPHKASETEFVLPNFIHENYKIAENAVGYPGIGGEVGHVGEKCVRDSKVDVLSESRSEGEMSLNICADERMPPRGELSGQESNGDMESPWSGMYTEVTPSEPYDLIARESWVSDGSEIDTTEKREPLEDDLPYPKGRQFLCAACCARFTSARELRAHRALVHAPPACSSGKASLTSYSRMVTARAIKKEEKTDDGVMDGTMALAATNLLSLGDSKPDLASTMLQVYDAMNESKPAIEGLIKQETKRRRRDYVCPTCKVDQLSDAAFHAHLKIHPLECMTCGKCFFKRANLALHMKTHLGIKNYKCDVCEKRFMTRQKLSEHYNVHTGRAPFKCTHCDDAFRRYSNMVQHRDRHHFQKKAKVRDYVCHCGAVYHSRAKLLWHKETHEERPKACLHCSDKFVHAASLTRHVRRTHNAYYLSERARGKVDNVPCPVCKQLYLRTNLRAHLQTHSGKRPFVCIVCNKAFTTKWNLKLHRWTHASRSAKPFKCNLCKGAFIRQTEYISHMNAHKSVKPYTCKYCGCQFIRKYNCQRHVREHETAKKYVCKVPECGKSFHRNYYLSEHMKVHSGARPFSCNICGKTSSNKSNHNKHVKIHHAREPVATEA